MRKSIDYGNDQTASDLMEFRQAFDQPYDYDAIGRLISDPHKKITFEYNFLNLPRLIKGQGGRTVAEYIYDALGTKYQVNYSTTASPTIYSDVYTFNKIHYSDGSIRLLTQEGNMSHVTCHASQPEKIDFLTVPPRFF